MMVTTRSILFCFLIAASIGHSARSEYPCFDDTTSGFTVKSEELLIASGDRSSAAFLFPSLPLRCEESFCYLKTGKVFHFTKTIGFKGVSQRTFNICNAEAVCLLAFYSSVDTFSCSRAGGGTSKKSSDRGSLLGSRDDLKIFAITAGVAVGGILLFKASDVKTWKMPDP